MGHNCVVRLPAGKDDARDPLMWNAAHWCALRWLADVRSTRILRCSGARLRTQIERRSLAIRLTILLWSGRAAWRALLCRTGCA